MLLFDALKRRGYFPVSDDVRHAISKSEFTHLSLDEVLSTFVDDEIRTAMSMLKTVARLRDRVADGGYDRDDWDDQGYQMTDAQYKSYCEVRNASERKRQLDSANAQEEKAIRRLTLVNRLLEVGPEMSRPKHVPGRLRKKAVDALLKDIRSACERFTNELSDSVAGAEESEVRR